MFQKIRNGVSFNYLWITLIAFLLLFCIYLLISSKSETNDSPYVSTSAQSQEDDSSVEEFANEIKAGWKKMHFEAIGEEGDSAFTSFVVNELEIACPFFEPDGVHYRICMEEFIENKKPYHSSDEILQSDEYCQDMAFSKFGGTAATDLYLSCLAFKLSRHTN